CETYKDSRQEQQPNMTKKRGTGKRSSKAVPMKKQKLETKQTCFEKLWDIEGPVEEYQDDYPTINDKYRVKRRQFSIDGIDLTVYRSNGGGNESREDSDEGTYSWPVRNLSVEFAETRRERKQAERAAAAAIPVDTAASSQQTVASQAGGKSVCCPYAETHAAAKTRMIQQYHHFLKIRRGFDRVKAKWEDEHKGELDRLNKRLAELEQMAGNEKEEGLQESQRAQSDQWMRDMQTQLMVAQMDAMHLQDRNGKLETERAELSMKLENEKRATRRQQVMINTCKGQIIELTKTRRREELERRQMEEEMEQADYSS
ncbi:hypothetical protein PMAYCL1PPCAC_16437, partial [Pristionchus mayeri]